LCGIHCVQTRDSTTQSTLLISHILLIATVFFSSFFLSFVFDDVNDNDVNQQEGDSKISESGISTLATYLETHPEGVERVVESEIVQNAPEILKSDISSLFSFSLSLFAFILQFCFDDEMNKKYQFFD
jgi:hypothetical protein